MGQIGDKTGCTGTERTNRLVSGTERINGLVILGT